MPERATIDRELRLLADLAPAGYFVGLHIRFAAPLMTFKTYDQAWIDRYTAQAYAMRDPMSAWGFSTVGAARWSEIEVPDTFGIMEEAASYGLKYGVQVACGPISSRTIGGIARSDREFTDVERDRALGVHEHDLQVGHLRRAEVTIVVRRLGDPRRSLRDGVDRIVDVDRLARLDEAN